MANQKLCDFCDEIIHKKLYYISVSKGTLTNKKNNLLSFMSIEDAFSFIQYKSEEIESNMKCFEICDSCKKVLDYLLLLRKEELEILKQQVNGTLNFEREVGRNDKEI